jgi:hypothetical protein
LILFIENLPSPHSRMANLPGRHIPTICYMKSA